MLKPAISIATKMSIILATFLTSVLSYLFGLKPQDNVLIQVLGKPLMGNVKTRLRIKYNKHIIHIIYQNHTRFLCWVLYNQYDLGRIYFKNGAV